MIAVQLTLTVTSTSPLSVGAGGSAGTYADKTIVRDGWGRPIIPGSQVKGKARWAAEQILRGLGQDIPAPFEPRERVEIDTPVRKLFGSPESPSRLFFADLAGVVGNVAEATALRLDPEQRQTSIRPSVAISRRRGTAEDQRLLFQETALEGTRFFAERAVMGQAPTLGHVGLLWAALLLTPRWGGAKSRGLGWSTVDVQVFIEGSHASDEGLREALRSILSGKEA